MLTSCTQIIIFYFYPLQILSGSLLITGGILFIVLPNVFIALTLSCTFEGMAFGIMQVQAFVTGAEVANKDIRGLIMSSERIFIWLGILLQLTYTYLWYLLEPTTGHTMHADQNHGIVVACLGAAAIISTLKQRTESPLLLLQQQRDLAVAATLSQLQGTHSTSNTEVMRMREDCLQLLAVDADDSCWYIFRKHNFWPLFKVLILRCFVTLSMSQPFNRVYLSASWLGFNCDMNCLYILAVAGLVGSSLGAVLIDRYGRRRMCVVTLLPATMFMFLAGGILDYLKHADVAMIPFDLEIIASVILLYQFIICLGVSITATVYLSEAFTVTQKPKCIAAILVGENLLQVCLAVVSFTVSINAAALYFSMGVFCLLLGLYVFLCLPETKCLTLYECLQKFKAVLLSK